MDLPIKCPLILAPDETGKVTANIANRINEKVTPTVRAQISHPGEPRMIDQIVTLEPNASETLTWEVQPSDVIFGRLILVDVFQLRYRDNPSMLGSCGIFLFSLLGLSGLATFSLVLVLSLAAMLGGAIFWRQAHPQPWNNYTVNLARAGMALMGITILSLLTLFPRWWGLTLFFNALTLLAMGIIFTDFVLFQKHKS